MAPLAEATVVVMPLCKGVRLVGLAPAQDEKDDRSGGENGALGGWLVQLGKFAMIGLVSLGLIAVSVVIAVLFMMFVLKQDDPVMTSTSSTAIATTTSTMTMPEINTVSENFLTRFMLVLFL
jgi:hypothetical protein